MRASPGPIPTPITFGFLLREVYENQEKARHRGAAAAREAAGKWTWSHAARKIIARLDEVDA